MTSASSFYESLLHGLTDRADGPERIRASAAVVPWRAGDGGEIEVYWVRRAASLAFMGGWWAFPGGGLSRRDAAVQVLAPDHSDVTTPPSPGLSAERLRQLGPDLVPGLAACAVRELFEETGLWLGDPAPDRGALPALEDARRRLLAGEVSFGELAEELESRPDARQLTFAGRWLTPPFAPMRFDNRFFLLHWPRSRALQPTPDLGELDRGEWIRPADALARWHAGEVMTAPPILHILRTLARGDGEPDAARLVDTADADLGPLRRIEFAPGLILLPMRTPTLPPATHTNVFLVGDRRAVLIDPAPHDPGERQRLLAALDAAQAQGLEITAIWLSHHHGDHVGAVAEARRHLGVPVLAHTESAAPLAAWNIELDGELTDGQEVRLGDTTVRIHHTPGHTRGHLAFELVEPRALIAADLVSTLSTIVIDPPDGQMSDYLASLERMAAHDFRLLLPSHGPVKLAPKRLLEKTIRHRLEREAKVKTAYDAGLTTAAAMVAEVYDDVPPAVHPVAQRQIEAHLERLRALGDID